MSAVHRAYCNREADSTLAARVRCANCDRGPFHPADLSPDELCERCVARAQDDAEAVRAEAMRRP